MKLNVYAPLLVLVLSSCATSPPAPQVPVEVPQARLSPAPAAVMVPRSANYRQRLCAIWSRLSTTQTEMCASLATLKP